MMDPCGNTHKQTRTHTDVCMGESSSSTKTDKYTARDQTAVLKGCNTTGLTHYTQLILISCIHEKCFIFISAK